MWEDEFDAHKGLPAVPEPTDPAEMNTHYGKPESEDCSSSEVPPLKVSKENPKSILLPDLVSMWKYLLTRKFANQRLNLYSYLNRILRNGRLSSIVGFRVLNRTINKAACNLANATFWKDDRERFLSMVKVEMSLESETGTRTWTGYLVCDCCFSDTGFSCFVEDLVDDPEIYTENRVMLNPFLVPYYSNNQMERIADQIWIKYGMEDALTNPEKRDPFELARRMGLKIQCLPIYEHQNVNGILFFAEGPLIIGEDRMLCHEDGSRDHIKAKTGTTVVIPANTIVINTNRISEKYPFFCIFHECIHYELHYMFFRLQQMCSNDIRQVRTIEIEPVDGKVYSNPIYFMEKQADRGAYGLMMPATHTIQMIETESQKVISCQNDGEKFEIIGISLARQLELPHFRIRARMIQLGYIAAKGALNYVIRDKRIRPFAFDPAAWRESDISYVIDYVTVDRLREESVAFDFLISEGKYIYADGHVVRNTPRFVMHEYGRDFLTDEARKKVNDCCLRFVRQFVQRNVGQYVYGRMFYDPEYVERTLFFLDDLINKQQMDELDAKMAYRDNFPNSFVDAFDMLMRKSGETRETMAAKLHITEKTLREWLNDPEQKISRDFVVTIALMWKLPDWISNLMIDRGMVYIRENDRRHQALEYIRTVLWDRGIDEANKYLTSKGLSPLSI